VTGSNGREPFVFVWDTKTAGQETKELIQLPRGSRSVSALGFKDDKFVYAADMSDNFMVHIFDITKEKTKAGKL
jgi:hypothetical protein